MIEIIIRLKKNFIPTSYLFGCSKTNDIATVLNWQDGNNSILISESGQWFCFAKKKNSNKVSIFNVNVDCSGINPPPPNTCTISPLPPFMLGTNQPVGCTISPLPPYTILNGAVVCQIQGVSPYTIGGTIIVTPSTSKVYYEGGKKIYNANGTVSNTPIIPQITNDYIFTETVCRSCGGGYRLMYAFEEGDDLGGTYNGWKLQTAGFSVDLSKLAGRTVLFKSACVGYAYNQVADLQSTYIYLKSKGTSKSGNGLTYFGYANDFVPDFTNNLPSIFRGRIPKFTLPVQKHNIYEGVMPRDAVLVDLREYGISEWHLKAEAKTTFPANLCYITDPDTQFGDVASYNQTSVGADNNLVNTFSQQEMINRANGYSTYGNIGTLIIDDEFRQGKYYTPTGLSNMLTFFEKAKANLPNTKLSAHHNFPIKWDKNQATDLSDTNLFNGFYPTERDLFNARNNDFLAQYWTQQGSKNIGNDIFKVISIDAYTHFHNNPSEAFKWMMLVRIHRERYPNHIVTLTLEGWQELLANDFGANSKEVISWKTGNNSAETLGAFPIMSICLFEQLVMIAVILGHGFNYWGDFLLRNMNRPDLYYALNSNVGTPEGYTNESQATINGVYQSQPTTGIDYVFLTLEKISRIPQGFDWNNPVYFEMSLDNGGTWITGDELIFGFSERRKRPVAFGLKNPTTGKFVICAMHPYNNPISDYTFMVRTTGMNPVSVTVTGQSPELILNNN